jgi:phospholipid/cholesterol/gamma-HCH transport system substrate-binding protein
VALVGALLIVIVLLVGGGSSYQVTAEFQNASQLVSGGQVEVAGTPAGKIKSISLGERGEALVKMEIDPKYAPLHRGTQAVIRAQSLSGIANRYIELNLPPANKQGPEIPSGGYMPQAETVSEVDLDQLFNTFDKKTIANFKNVLTGFAVAYDGVAKQTNVGFHYANPLLSTSRRVFGQLNKDTRRFESLIVDSAALSSALDARAPEIGNLVHNLNAMMGAIGRQASSLQAAIGQLPAFMRLFNTTAVNLRFTLDDLTPLVNASKPVAKKLQPFAANLRAFARNAVPTIADLDEIIRRPGANNDLIELTKLQVPLAQIAVGPVNRDAASRQGALPESSQALQGGLHQLAFLRPYVSEEAIGGWFDDFGAHSGVVDANGGVSRISVTFNAYSPSIFAAPNLAAFLLAVANPANVIPINTVFNNLLKLNQLRKCPGANERDPGDNSTPFTDNGQLDCDPSEVPTGP